MPSSTLLSDIKNKYHTLTKAEKKVADFVLAEPQTVMNATITDLSELCGTGETSVFRFCRSMQLNGYQEFKLSLALSTNSSGTADLWHHPAGAKDSGATVYQVCMDALQRAVGSVEQGAINRTIELFVGAKSICFFGIGGSAISALEAQNRFLKVTAKVFFTSDAHMQMTAASLLGKDSVAVVFSNSGTTKDAISIARLAKESGANVVFVTQFLKTPAGKYSDVILPCGAAEGPMEGGSISAKLSQLFMVELLYREYFGALGETAVNNKTITATSIATEML